MPEIWLGYSQSEIILDIKYEKYFPYTEAPDE